MGVVNRSLSAEEGHFLSLSTAAKRDLWRVFFSACRGPMTRTGLTFQHVSGTKADIKRQEEEKENPESLLALYARVERQPESQSEASPGG